MNKKRTQRILSLVLALTFLLSGTTVLAAAEENTLLMAPTLTVTPEADTVKPVVNNSVTDATIDDVREILDSNSYDEYRAKYCTVETVVVDGVKNTVYTWKVAPGKEEIVIDAIADLYAQESDAAYKIETYDGVEALYTPSSGTVSWKVSIPETARYSIVIEYYAVHKTNDGTVVSKATDIGRIFRINSAIPFLEARYLTLPKTYSNDYIDGAIKAKDAADASALLAKGEAVGFVGKIEERENGTYVVFAFPEAWTSDKIAYCEETGLRFFTQDIDNNEIRPTISQDPVWKEYEIRDGNGYHAESFEFVFEESEETVISLTGVSEPMAIKSIRLIPHENYQSFEQVSSGYPTKVGTDKVQLEGEYPYTTSSQTVYPMEDTRSALTKPIETAYTLLNSIGGVGGEKWNSAGQSVSYKFSVKESGVYNIVARFSQSTLDGMYSSRSLGIYTDYTKDAYKAKFGDLDGYYNGVPCEEASRLRFDYSTKWQTKILSDGVTDLSFYFEAGVEYRIDIGVTLGSMGLLVAQVEEALEAINSDYLSILMLTGADPDKYRDYGFKRVMPDVVEDLRKNSELLYDLVAELENMSGIKGSMAATLETVAWLLGRMGNDPENEIAKNLAQFKSNIGSLGTWISSAKTQPLQIDYLLIQGTDQPLPKAEANFFQSLGHEIRSFFQSFFRNYDRMGAMEDYDEDDDEIVEVWLAYGRDQSQVIRNLINNDFTPDTGVPVNLKLVAGGTLLPSILARSGPDVYIGLGQADIINYAIRGALIAIEGCEGFDELCLNEETRQFNEAAMLVLGIEDATKTMHYYGLPETQTFNMMFIRKDILADLDLDIPKTWDDILAAIPILQANNMQIGMHSDYQIFLYQMGGELFADGGMRINLDSNTGLEAFEFMCSLYTNYSFPYAYDFANRFRTGEMPIGFAAYTGTYNNLKVFATEIEGLWGMYPMPGTVDANGNINNCAVSAVTAIAMITGCENIDGAWEFMKWHSGASCQEQYSNEMVAILGPSAKHPTANIEALEGLPWSADELKEIKLQFNNLASVPNYPGSYIIGRYTGFALLAAINSGANPAEELLSYIITINKEITRKRQEFELETLDYVGQKLSEKRILQALTLLEDGKLSIEMGVLREDGEVVLDTIQYAISSNLKKQYADEFAHMITELSRAADTENRIDNAKQMAILNECIATMSGFTAQAGDEIGVNEVISLMNDALEALISYQE
ncbi:MAG: extracellular solute-binding protein [Ruminococcaceae bacterium]|nr:extracellular solute-binding protein [Oscillospiraceae bacterium]